MSEIGDFSSVPKINNQKHTVHTTVSVVFLAERLTGVFKTYGNIMNIRVLADKGYAFIT